MDLTKGQVDRLREELGDNLVDADVDILTGTICLVRCAFQGPPDPNRIGKYVFTDAKLQTLECFHVPTFAIEIIRKTRNVFYSEKTRLYGISLDIFDLYDIMGPPLVDADSSKSERSGE